MTNEEFKEFELPTNPQSLDEIITATVPVQGDQVLYLVKKGIDPHKALDIVGTNINLAKWFAANYHRLIQEGKIPEDMQYRAGSEFTRDVERQSLHRALDKIIQEPSDD